MNHLPLSNTVIVTHFYSRYRSFLRLSLNTLKKTPPLLRQMFLFITHILDNASPTPTKKRWRPLRKIEGIEVVDLYEEYPRFNIDIGLEQQRLLGHDLALILCPLFSTQRRHSSKHGRIWFSSNVLLTVTAATVCKVSA